MAIRGVRVYSWSPFETKAFGSLFYEVKKKVVHWTTIVGSTWSSMIPTMIATYALIKWAENEYHHEQVKHRS